MIESLIYAGLLGNHSVLDPPDPIPNSEVKRNRADDSVGSPHVKVGHCQALISKPRTDLVRGFFYARSNLNDLLSYSDDSVGSRNAGPPHIKVGHCQALTSKPRTNLVRGFFYARSNLNDLLSH